MELGRGIVLRRYGGLRTTVLTRGSALGRISADGPEAKPSLRQRGRQQNVRELAWTLDMAIVASLQFGNSPAGRPRFRSKWFEKSLGRVSFRNATHEGCGNGGLSIRRKAKRLLNGMQTEVT